MAFTERYSNNGGSGLADGTSEANAWDLPDALTNATAGMRVNHKGAVTLAADAFTNAGTIDAPIILRGYNATIGDLDGLGRDSTGDLVTTDMPDLTLTGLLTMNTYCILQNLDITGALSGPLIGNTTVDRWRMVSCRVVNTQNNAAASCLHGDDYLELLNCDISCTGASHNRLVLADVGFRAVGCRFQTTAAATCLEIAGGTVARSIFFGHSSTVGVYFDAISASTNNNWVVDECTFYAIGTCIQLVDQIPQDIISATNNHATDCAKWLDNLGSGSRNVVVVESYNRLRDVTTPRTGIESISIGEITTDTGGAETDYVDAANGDFHLIAAAPGYAAGLHGQDIGAEQHDVPAGGGGGTPGNTRGGMQ